jgi:intracellular septation protein A
MKHPDNMNWITEALALVFGMLILLIIFGDSTPIPIKGVGNLDTIFGHKFWRLMDVIYPLASVIVFLGYGKSKGAIRFRFTSTLLCLIFLFSIVLMQFDDIVAVFNHPIQLSNGYWTAVRWIYFITAISTFLTFGKECEKMKKDK